MPTISIFHLVTLMFPSFTSLHAIVTVTHFECPITTTIFDPATLHEYSIEPKTSSLMIFSATLLLKTSPIPWSNTNSAGTR